MNFFVLLLGAFLASLDPNVKLAGDHPEQWEQFKAEHGKVYEDSNVEVMRRAIFARNKLQVDKFNSNFASRVDFEVKLNHLADLSEFDIGLMNGFKLPNNHELLMQNSPEAQKFLDDILNDNSTVPDEVDWRKTPGRVSRVKNQGSCGSCWAFASTGVLEGQEIVHKKSFLGGEISDQVVELSEQNLVDCDRAEDQGCGGGFMKNALEFVKQEGGLDDEKSYPYEARDKKCRFRKDKVVFTDSGAAILPQGDEQKLKEVVAKFGPVAVAIDASSIWFQFYHKGVYVNHFCRNSPKSLDHGVLVVGYGTDPKKGDYWIVKNSWGPHYGESGYIRMARNRKNMCGIATMATIPTF